MTVVCWSNSCCGGGCARDCTCDGHYDGTSYEKSWALDYQADPREMQAGQKYDRHGGEECDEIVRREAAE